MLRKFGIIAVLSLMALALAAVPAFAGSPHFIKNATSASLSGANLVVNFKEAGLESGSVETITTGATATTTYECVGLQQDHDGDRCVDERHLHRR